MIADTVKVPTHAAGGITTRRGFRSVLVPGAQGVYCGTLFLMSTESRLAPHVKEAVIQVATRDLLTLRSLPAFCRSLQGELADPLMEMSLSGAAYEGIDGKMGGFAGLRIGMPEGDMNKGCVSVGNGITCISSVQPVARIMEYLTRE